MNTINFFDILTLLVALWAVVAGWRRGVVLQVGSLTGIVLALYLASRYATQAGELLHMSEGWVTPGGFLAVAVVTMIVVSLLGRLCRKLFQFVGLGVLDVLFGILLSLVKWMLLLSALYSAFGALNRSTHWVEPKTLNESYTYTPVSRLTDYVLPFVHKALDGADWEQLLPEQPTENTVPHDNTL